MRIVSTGIPGSEQPAVLVDDVVVPLGPLLKRQGLTSLDTNSILALLPELRPLIDKGLADPPVTMPVTSARLGPPVPHPEKVLIAGGNYQSHVDEASGQKNAPSPTDPILMIKPSNTVIGPTDPLVRPPQSEQLDYETEIAVVIGRGGFRIPRERAYEHVAGYMIANDVTARDLAFKDLHISPAFSQIVRAKGLRTGAPTGPWIATTDEIPDPHDLTLRCWVNGELRQQGSSGEMIVDIPALIADFSTIVELAPGDFIMTGTTTGCGAFQDPPSFLFEGDSVRMEITGLGVLETPILDEATS